MGAINLFNFGLSVFDVFPFFAGIFFALCSITSAIFAGYLIAFTPENEKTVETRMDA